MAIQADGCSFRDFIEQHTEPSELADALREGYERCDDVPEDFAGADALARYARRQGVEAAAADALWRAFALWRIDALATIARQAADPSDFG
jgi:hypothetical protein